MRQKYFYIIIIALSLILLSLIYWMKEREIDARLTFSYKDKIPYGCYTAYQLLEQHFGKTNTAITTKSPNDNEALFKKDSSCLFIVNSFFNPTDNDLDWLSFYAQKGNTVVISTGGLNHIAKKFFGCTPAPMFFENFDNKLLASEEKFTPMQLQISTLPNATKYTYAGIGYETHFIDYDTVIALPIGKNSQTVNVLQFNMGKGKVILQLAPVSFTNLFLLQGDNAMYLQQLLAYIAPFTNTMVWDDYFIHRRLLTTETKEKGLFTVLFSYQNFRWALYILLVAGLVLLLTEIKRKQQIIPIHAKPTNESLQFIQTVGLLYYNKADHKNLAQKMIANFLDVLRNKYHINTQFVNASLATQITQKCSIDSALANELIETIQHIQLQPEITETTLQTLYNTLQNFYKNA
jgi:hypothetical protein